MKSNCISPFCHITLEKMLKEIGKLQYIDIQTKIIKENSGIFAANNSSSTKTSLYNPGFSKKIPKIRKKIIDLLVSGLISQKFMKNSCINRFQITLEIFSPNFSVFSTGIYCATLSFSHDRKMEKVYKGIREKVIGKKRIFQKPSYAFRMILWSSWEKISGVPENTILGSLLFNIFCDLSSMLSNVDFASYVDDNTHYVINNNLKEAL